MVDVAKEEVLRLIPKLSELQLLEVCNNEGLKLTKSKKDRKSALQNLLVRHVSSEELEDSEDEGLALFTSLSILIKDLVANDDVEDDDDDSKKLDDLVPEHEKEARRQLLEIEMNATMKALKSTMQNF
jgi:hypothetical protein